MPATPLQIEAFNKLRTMEGEFTPEQQTIIKRLEDMGELENSIVPLMQKINAQGRPSDLVAIPAESVDSGIEYATDINRELDEKAGGFVDVLEKTAGIDPKDQQAILRLFSRQIMRPAAQAVGTAVGFTAGTVGEPGAGSAVGSALGFAIGDDLADLFDNITGLREPKPIIIELTEAGNNVAIGLASEVGGQALAMGLSKGAKAFMQTKAGKEAGNALMKMKGKLPPLLAKTAEGLTGRVLAADIGEGRTVIANNIDEAQILEDLIPGLKFQYGQTTKSGKAISFEKALEKEIPNFSALQAQRQAENIGAIQEFVNSHKTSANIGDTRKILQAEQDLIENGVMSARQTLEESAQALRPPTDEIAVGQTLRSSLAEGRLAAKEASSDMFESIVGKEVAPTGDIIKTIEKLGQKFDRAEVVEQNFPYELKRVYEDLMSASGNKIPENVPPGLYGVKTRPTEGPMSYVDINDYRKHLSRLSRKMKAAPTDTRNKLAEKRVEEVISAIEDVVTAGAKENKHTARAIKKARKMHRTTTYEPFETGRVKDVLDDKISDAKIASEFFVSGAEGQVAAKQFNAALGNNEVAKEAMERAISLDLLNSATDKVTKEVDSKKLIKWLSENRYALKEFELLDKYKGVENAAEEVLKAVEAEKAFKRSTASDILKSDVGDEIANVMSSKYRGQKITSLMRQLGGRKNAVEGVQNALIEELQKVPINSAKDINRYMEKTRNMYNAAFANDRTKLQAVKTYQNAINRVFPEGTPITGDVEDFIKVLNAMSKPAAKQRGLVGTAITAVKDVLKYRADTEIKALMTKASLDPEFAFSLMYSLRKGKPKAVNALITRTLKQYGMSQLAEYEE